MSFYDKDKMNFRQLVQNSAEAACCETCRFFSLKNSSVRENFMIENSARRKINLKFKQYETKI